MKKNKIRYICHLSDIHIRLLQRHKEYRQVFKTLYKQLKNYNSNETVIVITGDIVHTKTDLSPESVGLVSEFLTKLCNIMDVIIIAGNHDGNLSNDSRLDSLTPIVEALNLNNLYYYKNTGTYKFGKNLHFSLASVFDKTLPDVKTLDKDRIKIALYHGAINHCKTDTGFEMINEKFSASDFKGYDLTLLGDIHKPFQYLNKKKTIAYPGSLLQNNYGEKKLKRGYFVWNLDTLTAEEVIIPNDYGYITLEVKSGLLKNNNLKDIPKKAKIRFLLENTKNSELKEIIKKLKKDYDLQEIIVNRVDNSKDIKRLTEYNLSDNIRNPKFQSKLIKEYLNQNSKLKKTDIKKAIALNEDFNAQLTKNDESDNKMNISNWKIKSLKFENMFSYGKHNKINFEKLSNVVGLFGKNASGKSSLIDVILFALFDRTSRAFKGEDIININKDNFYLLLNFKIDDVDYFIEKIGKRHHQNKVKVDVNFWSKKNNIKEDLNGTQRKETVKEIKKYIGKIDEFTLTSVSLQNNNTGFIDMRQSDRKEFLSQTLKLNIFDDLHSLASDEIRDLNKSLKEYQEDGIEEQLETAEEELNKKEKKLKNIKNKFKQKKRNYKEVENKLYKKIKELKTIKTILKETNIETLEKNCDKTLNQIKGIKNQLDLIETKLERLSNKANELEDLIKDEKKINSNYDLYKKMVDIKDRVASKVLNINLKLKPKLEKMEKLKGLEYDPDCKYCMSNPFTLDAIKIKKKIGKNKLKLKEIKEKQKEIENKFNETKKYKIAYDEFTSDIENLRLVENELKELKISKLELLNKKEKVKNLLSTILSNIDLYKQNKKDINWNQIIQKEIDILTNDKDKLQKSIDDLGEIHSEYISDINLAKSIIKNLNERAKYMKKIEENLKILKKYNEAVSKNGIPYTLINQIIPALEEESNNILSLITDFGVIFYMDGKNINLKIVKDEDTIWPIELASGFEKFISSLAIRIAITKISNLTKPNFIAIDEGWGNFDSTNISNVNIIFDYLKTQFDFVIVISHLDALKGSVDSSLEIQNKYNYSYINNS